MAALSHLADRLVETVEESSKSLRNAADLVGVEIKDGRYSPIDRPPVIPQSLRNADFVFLMLAQAEREAALIAIIESLAQRLVVAEQKIKSTGGAKK